METQQNDLDGLRRDIELTTKSILDLVRRRQNLSIQIARAKRAKNLPIDNSAVEARLLKVVDDYGSRIGLDPRLGESLVRTLIEASKEQQGKEFHAEAIRSFLKEKGINDVSVIGAGRMGLWLAGYIRPFVRHVTLMDKDSELARNRAISLDFSQAHNLGSALRADLVFVAVPVGDTAAQLERIIDHYSSSRDRKGKTVYVVEVSSVKAPTAEILSFRPRLEEIKHVRLSSLHPLFGPSAQYFSNNTIAEVFFDGNAQSESDDDSPSAKGLAFGLFPHFTIVKMNWQTHDKLMAELLSLPHLLALVFARVVAEKKGSLEIEGRRLSTPSFESLLKLSQKVLSENPRVFSDIQSKNPYTAEILGMVTKTTAELCSLASRDKELEREFLITKEKLLSEHS